MSWSLSKKGVCKREANARPKKDLPQPMKPIRKIRIVFYYFCAKVHAFVQNMEKKSDDTGGVAHSPLLFIFATKIFKNKKEMMKKNWLFYMALSVLLSSCASVQQKSWLSAHQQAIGAAADDASLNAEQKMDVLLKHYGDMMEEGLKFTDPRKGVKYIGKFQKANEANIDKILSASNTWLEGLSTEQTLMLLLKIPSKSEIKRFFKVGQSFYKKYQAYESVIRFTSKVGDVFGKFGKSRIGL
jgi:hypothetical protein